REDEDILLNRLLGGEDRPSVIEREALWGRIERSLRVRRTGWFAGLTLGVLGAVTAALLLFSPGSEFGIRGGERATLRLACIHNEAPTRCAANTTLVLRIAPPQGAPNVAAFVERADGAVVWITPSASETSEPLTENPPAIRLSADWPSGKSTAVVICTPEPVNREALKQALEGDLPKSWSVVERTFSVAKGSNQ
ncbi:MAG: hypothetical protein AAF658_06040, partial [Myxococcota bacterium]